MIDTKHDDRPGGRHASLELADDAVSTGPIYAARHEVVDWSDLSASVPTRRMFGRIGTRAAERAQLAKLPSTWRVVHSAPAGENGTDAGDLVIGPSGVFLVTGKDDPDAVARTAELISAVAGREVEVGAVVVATAAQRKQLSQRLADHPVVLSDADVEALHALARRSTTWEPSDSLSACDLLKELLS